MRLILSFVFFLFSQTLYCQDTTQFVTNYSHTGYFQNKEQHNNDDHVYRPTKWEAEFVGDKIDNVRNGFILYSVLEYEYLDGIHVMVVYNNHFKRKFEMRMDSNYQVVSIYDKQTNSLYYFYK